MTYFPDNDRQLLSDCQGAKTSFPFQVWSKGGCRDSAADFRKTRIDKEMPLEMIAGIGRAALVLFPAPAG